MSNKRTDDDNDDMAGETGGGGDREGPSPPGPINSIS